MDIDREIAVVSRIAQRRTELLDKSGRGALPNRSADRSGHHLLDATFAGAMAPSGQFYD